MGPRPATVAPHRAEALTGHAAGRHYRIEELIATFLRKLRGAVAVDLGRRAVVGRPVRYWGAQTADDETRASTE